METQKIFGKVGTYTTQDDSEIRIVSALHHIGINPYFVFINGERIQRWHSRYLLQVQAYTADDFRRDADPSLSFERLAPDDVEDNYDAARWAIRAIDTIVDHYREFKTFAGCPKPHAR